MAANKDSYRVKFVWKGNPRFGVVQHHDNEAKEAWANGNVIIYDAVLPESYLVVNDDNVQDVPNEIKWEHGRRVYDAYDQYVQDAFDAARKISDALPDGVHVGSMFQIGVGDGYAYYVVTKLNKKTCKVEWRGFCADTYYDHHFKSGGTFQIDDVAEYVHSYQLQGRSTL